MNGSFVFMLGPVTDHGPEWSHAQAVVFIVLALTLAIGCVVLLRAHRRERSEAHIQHGEHARAIERQVHRMEQRIRAALEGSATTAREQADVGISERSDGVFRTVLEGTERLRERIKAVEQREVDRAERLHLRMETVMTELHRASKGAMRLLLDRTGLADALEDLRWFLEARGPLRVALEMRGVGQPMGVDPELRILRIVRDMVDSSLGSTGVDRLVIRCERSGDTCLVSVENNGIARETGRSSVEAGHRRLEAGVARFNGSLTTDLLSGGGYAIRVVVPVIG